ncbi:MAG: 4-hydroxy-3-methylbut-2-enyl diphosphate reductase [Bacteroidales bacterium]|nr:4-hydroxy-3-methylbut-2-enyl diphosphate reductase [Bacteroidales bacterium]
MSIKIEIDENSGFCYGVVRAIEQAENYLKYSSRLYSLGAIVHNSAEIERLSERGLQILNIMDVEQLKNDVLLIRAHGEPPSTYSLALNNNLQIIDCTCPVVLKLQEKIRETYEDMKDDGGQIVIFGKRGHAEVNGLVGQTNSEAIVIENVDEISKIDFNRPVAIFSQTTKDPKEYENICSIISEKYKDKKIKIFDTICKQVASRHKHLVDFAKEHSVILFVSGRESSNGKILFELCKAANPRTYWLENKNQIDNRWFMNGDVVGICGATSTPKWQLEEIFISLSHTLNNKK